MGTQMIVTCQKCKASKFRGDACSVCASGLRPQTMIVRTNKPVSLARAHFFHAANSGVPAATARGDYRR